MTACTVVTALSVEARAVRRGLRDASALERVRVVRIGMGPDRAARAVGALPPGPVAVFGVCGALVRGLEPGDVVVATQVHGARSAPARCLGAEDVAGVLRGRGFTVHAGLVLTTRRPVFGRRAREAAAASGAIAVDMESAAVVAARRPTAPRWTAQQSTAPRDLADGAALGCCAPGRDVPERPTHLHETADTPVLVVRVVVDGPGVGLWSPRVVVAGVRALRTLRRVAPVVLDWTEQRWAEQGR